MERLSDEVRNKLRAPLPAEAVKPHPTKTYLSTIKAIYVTERFSDVFGVNGWHIETDMLNWHEKTTAKGKAEYTVVAKTTLTVPEFGIQHECIAGSTNEDFGDAAKGATTDAITKIGSYLEVGIDVFKGKGGEKALKSAPKKPEAPKTPPKTKEELTPEHKSWSYVKDRIKSGVTLETIKQTFTLSEANAKLLTA